MSFSQALSGLSAQADNIKVISNNIANSQTVGFKGGRTSFADIFAGAGAIGLGVRVAGINQDFRSGDLENTGRELDLAIAGRGFFRMEKVNGEIVYSRNGEINQDAQGYLVNAIGHKLTGYGLSDPNDPFSAVIPGGAPVALQIPPDDMPAEETANVSSIYNLDASTQAAPDGLQTGTVVTDNPNPGDTENITFHFSSSYTVYDSLGNERTITSYFTKTGDNVWDVELALDGFRATGAVGNADFTLNFNTNGQFDPAGTTPVPITGGTGVAAGGVTAGEELVTLTFAATAFSLGGAEDLDFELDFAGTTQFNNNSVLNRLDQDGFTSGTLTGLEITDEGKVIRIFTNEERRDAGQVVLTNFINPEGLQPDGDNAWRRTNASGEPILGAAGTGVLGTIESQTLENSNVDLAEQLVDMIVAQRAYQANSSSIGTQDEMLQTVINL